MFAFLNTKTFRALILLFLFSVSILIRLPELRSDLNRESEWQTAHVLTTLSIWESNGISEHYYSPVWTFNTPADKCTNSLGGIKDKNNFTYYTSYPPFSFILPYFVFKSIGTKVSVIALRIFSLCVHFICALLILLITRTFHRNSLSERFPLPAFIAFSVYLFSAGNLWFHGNFYFADSLVQLFILSSLYVFSSVLKNPEKNQIIKCFALALFTFLGIYTEWLALFIAGIMLLFLVAGSRKNKIYRPYILYVVLAILLSLGLTLIQYSSIAGLHELKQQSFTKFSSRNGFIGEAADGLSITNPNSFYEIYNNYIRHYNYHGLLLVIFLSLTLWRPFRIKIKSSLHQTPFAILSIVAFSILIHHVLFFNFTAMHDISALKSSLWFSLFFGYVAGLFISGSVQRLDFRNAFMIVLCSLFVFLSASRYKLVLANNEDNYYQERTGKLIAEFSAANEMVFTNIGVSPIMMWYSKRNPIMVINEEECIKKMEEFKYNKGVFFKMDTTGAYSFFEVIRLHADLKPHELGREQIVLPDFN